MSKDNGWIKLYRSSFSNRLYFAEPFTKWQAWVDLLLLANHDSGTYKIRGVKVEICRGQTGFSCVELAKRWKWSRRTANSFLNALQNAQQIEQQKSNVTTLISIVNYERYQKSEQQNEQQNAQQNIQNVDTNKNNTIKNITNIAITDSPFFPIAKNFNGLPEITKTNLKNLVKATRKLDVEDEEADSLWEVFKTMNLTGDKPYPSEKDVYRHFTNWAVRQPFRKKTGTRTAAKTKTLTPYQQQIEEARKNFKPTTEI